MPSKIHFCKILLAHSSWKRRWYWLQSNLVPTVLWSGIIHLFIVCLTAFVSVHIETASKTDMLLFFIGEVRGGRCWATPEPSEWEPSPRFTLTPPTFHHTHTHHSFPLKILKTTNGFVPYGHIYTWHAQTLFLHHKTGFWMHNVFFLCVFKTIRQSCYVSLLCSKGILFCVR